MAVPFNKISLRNKKKKYSQKKLKLSKIIAKKYSVFFILSKEKKWILKHKKIL
jgi:hypothetical protein